jgi:NAD(P) transhydrogenase subunit alpha
VIVAVPRETAPGETRVPLIPATVKKLVEAGVSITVEQGIGETCRYTDADYSDAGAEIAADRSSILGTADVVLRLNKPDADEVALLKSGCIHVSYLDPFNELELMGKLADQGVHAVSMELIPRSTRAQKMDALSSQASLAGYVAVILAAERLDAVFPMMTTPAGTIYPARVFIIGAGVAGLQAIATAKRLGARVEAFDTRPVVEEQVQSLGARFVKVDLGEQEQTADGYARELTPEQLERQREMMASHCASSDVVITTAQVFGRKAPLIVTKEIIERMKPGSVIVDMAVETGGNVALSELGKEVDAGGVRILGYPNLAGRVPLAASQMYSSNIGNFVEEFWNAESGALELDPSDEIIAGCLVTADGKIVNEKIQASQTE